jgi:hypothetical protein
MALIEIKATARQRNLNVFMNNLGLRINSGK